MKKIYLILLVNLFLIANINAQKKEIGQIMSAIRAGKTYNVSTTEILKPGNSDKVFKQLFPYYTDTVPAVRAQAFKFVASIGKKSDDKSLRVEAVNILSQACLYKDNITVSSAVKRLKYFNKEDFSDDARRAILKAVLSSPPYYKEFVMLAGYLELTKAKEHLKLQIREGKIAKTNKWKTYIALARMNDPEAISYITAKLDNMPKINDDIIYDVVPDLIFTRSQEVYKYILEILYSNNKNCFPANPEKTNKILCAYRVMEYLAPVTEDYPYKLSQSGDLEANNYKDALQDIRKWFLEHPNFIINREGY